MANTSFAEVYEKAIFKISDYGFFSSDKDIREDILHKYLTSAQVDMQRSTSINLFDWNLETKEYNNEISEDIQEILALGIAYYWLSAKTLRSDLLKNVIYSKEYQTFSPGNLLKEIQTLRKEVKQEFTGKVKEYGYVNSDLENLKV